MEPDTNHHTDTILAGADPSQKAIEPEKICPKCSSPITLGKFWPARHAA